MKNIIGFCDNSNSDTENIETVFCTEEKAVISVVDVYFDATNDTFPYFNDSFDLKVGDRVYVEGKREGLLGTVTAVKTKFKINMSIYKRVIAKPTLNLKGTFIRVKDKAVCFSPDKNITERFKAYLFPPCTEEDTYICGEGYSVSVDEIEPTDEISVETITKAIDICSDGGVIFISYIDGKGTAFIEGKHIHEVNFTIDGTVIDNIYCDCPYNGFCKHSEALHIALNKLYCNSDGILNSDFAAIDKNLFWHELAQNSEKITL